MKYLLIAAFAMSACGVHHVRADESARWEVAESVLRGTAPCEVKLHVDGELVVELRPNPNVFCPMPGMEE